VPDHDIPSAADGRQPADPSVPELAGPDEQALGPLDTVDAVFRGLTAGPRPLALNPARHAGGLPDRLVPLSELKAVLLHPATSSAARNKVLAEVIRRARSGPAPAAWLVGLTGIALPGLRRDRLRALPDPLGEHAGQQLAVPVPVAASARGGQLALNRGRKPVIDGIGDPSVGVRVGLPEVIVHQ